MKIDAKHQFIVASLSVIIMFAAGMIALTIGLLTAPLSDGGSPLGPMLNDTAIPIPIGL